MPTTPTKTSPSSLREQVYQHLRALMHRGELRPGSDLHLNALADQMGISRTPLRDALLRLEAEGFVEILNRKGVRIVELTLDHIRDIYELLGGLESAALVSVAHRIEAKTLARMRELNEEMIAALDASDFARYYDANLRFHDGYLSLSTNRDLVRQVHILKQRLYDFPRLEGFVPEWERSSTGEHRMLVEHLREGRIVQAADFLRDVHWSFSYQEKFIRRYYTAATHRKRPA